MKSKLIQLGVVMILLSPAATFAQSQGDPPGSIKLLPGYTHQRLRGIDTQVGKISRKDSLTIEYDIGELAGNYAEKKREDCKWFKEQTLNGRLMQVAYGKDKVLTITFPNGFANFYSTVNSDEDIADVLLIVSTYSPTDKPKK